jgi:hypothetical protein
MSKQSVWVTLILGLALCGLAASARADVLVQWTFPSDAQFNDGGAATGSFTFDATTGSVTDWSIDAGTGTYFSDTGNDFGDFLYTPATSSLVANIGPLEGFLSFCTPMMSSTFGITTINWTRCLGLDIFFPPVPTQTSLSDVGISLPVLPGCAGCFPSGSYETGLPNPLSFEIDLGPAGIVPMTVDLPTCDNNFLVLPLQNRCLKASANNAIEITSALVTGGGGGSSVPEPGSFFLVLVAMVLAIGLILQRRKNV